MSVVELVGRDQGLRVEDFFDGNYGVKHDGDTTFWWGGKEALSIHSEDYSTSATVNAFLRLVESRQIIIPPFASALDIGCGTGHDAVRFYRLGYDVVEGIDTSGQSIIISNILADQNVDPLKRKDVKFTKSNLFAFLPYTDQQDLIWFRGVADYVEEEDQRIAFELIQSKTALNGINVISAVTDEPKSLVSGQSTVPCHNTVPLHPVSVALINELYAPNRGWKRLFFKEDRDKVDTSHPDGKFNPRNAHTHSHVHAIYQRVEEIPIDKSFGRSASGLIVPGIIRGARTIEIGRALHEQTPSWVSIIDKGRAAGLSETEINKRLLVHRSNAERIIWKKANRRG